MGYYTRFELKIHDAPDEFKNVIDVYKSFIEKINNDEVDFDFPGFQWAFDYNGESQDETKWYDHDGDMTMFSRLFPEVTFKLIGNGEDNGDMWHEYYKNGRSVRKDAQVFIPPLKEGEL